VQVAAPPLAPEDNVVAPKDAFILPPEFGGRGVSIEGMPTLRPDPSPASAEPVFVCVDASGDTVTPLTINSWIAPVETQTTGP
jgi:hypothetical protein